MHQNIKFNDNGKFLQSGNSQEVCINSKLPTCCQDRSELEASALECVSTSTLTVSGRNVNVKIYQNTEGNSKFIIYAYDLHSTGLSGHKLMHT